jgi:hypothetical protein
MDTGGPGPGQVEPGKTNYFLVYRGGPGVARELAMGRAGMRIACASRRKIREKSRDS